MIRQSTHLKRKTVNVQPNLTEAFLSSSANFFLLWSFASSNLFLASDNPFCPFNFSWSNDFLSCSRFFLSDSATAAAPAAAPIATPATAALSALVPFLFLTINFHLLSYHRAVYPKMSEFQP